MLILEQKEAKKLDFFDRSVKQNQSSVLCLCSAILSSIRYFLLKTGPLRQHRPLLWVIFDSVVEMKHSIQHFCTWITSESSMNHSMTHQRLILFLNPMSYLKNSMYIFMIQWWIIPWIMYGSFDQSTKTSVMV